MKNNNYWIAQVCVLILGLALFGSGQSFAAKLQVRLDAGSDNQCTISGIVDTTTDTFSIYSWTDTSLSWTPSSTQFPIEMQAFTSSGSRYDIPDLWDGTMSGWAFLLPIGQDLTTVQWVQGQPNGWKGASFGWGGLRNSGGIIVLRSRNTLCYIPNAPNSVTDKTINNIQISPSKMTACTATLNGNLLFHIPYISYDNGAMTLSADFDYNPNPSYPTLIPFKLKNAPIINDPSFSCAASTLSSDFTIHIPDLLLPDGISYLWVDLTYSPALSIDGNFYWVVSGYGFK
jgi:hypothetical protein